VKDDKLVKMANEIAAFFAAEPDPGARLAGVAGHLKRFWDPRMRRQLLRYVDEAGGAGLGEVALEAIKKHRGDLTPVSGP
jgi:formate dehydrogenase subunit delta